jgi:hypothetical protein
MAIPVGRPFVGGNGAAWTEIAPRARKPAQVMIWSASITLRCSHNYDNKKDRRRRCNSSFNPVTLE